MKKVLTILVMLVLMATFVSAQEIKRCPSQTVWLTQGQACIAENRYGEEVKIGVIDVTDRQDACGIAVDGDVVWVDVGKEELVNELRFAVKDAGIIEGELQDADRCMISLISSVYQETSQEIPRETLPEISERIERISEGEYNDIKERTTIYKKNANIREYEKECKGCVKENLCVNTGLRFIEEGKALYCDIDQSIKKQRQEGDSCQNSFECSSNLCMYGECQGVQENISSIEDEARFKQDLLKVILEFIRKTLGLA